MHLINTIKRFLNFCLLVFIMCFFATTVFSQDFTQKSFDSIVNLKLSPLEKVSILKSVLNTKKQQKNIAGFYYNAAYYCWGQKGLFPNILNEGIYFLKQERSLREKNATSYSDKVERTISNIAIFSNKLLRYNDVITYGNQLIAYNKTPNKRLGNTYKLIGNVYTNLGDFKRAEENLNKAKLLFTKLKFPIQLYRTNNDLLKLYIDKKNKNILHIYTDLSSENNQIQINNQQEIKNTDLLKFSFNSGSVLYHHKHYKKALQLYKKALQLASIQKDSLNIVKSLTELGLSHLRLQNIDSSMFYYNKALNYHNTTKGLTLSALYNNIGELYLTKTNYKKALENFEKAINTITDTQDNFKTSIHLKDLLGYHLDKLNALLLFYQSKKDTSILKEAYALLTLIDAEFDAINHSSTAQISKLFWRKEGRDFYVNAVQICHLLNKPEKAFYFLEKSKGILLLENTTNFIAKELAQLPQTLIQQEESLNHKVLRFKKLLNSEKSKVVKDSLFLAQEQYYNFISSLEKKYSNYYRYKTNIPISSKHKVQASLKDNEVAISYILGNNKAFAYVLTKQQHIVLPLDYDKLTTLVETYKNHCTAPISNQNIFNAFKLNANQLYQTLFPKNAVINFKDYQKFTILPDGILNSISFDALIPELTTANYLIEYKDISYHNSFSLTFLNNTLKTTFQNKKTAFILNSFKDTSLSPLNIKSTIFLNHSPLNNQQVSKANFIKAFQNSGTVSISTHAGSNREKPWIALYDEKLYLNELFFLNSPKDFVVLNACETGVGKLQEGEGNYNLTRGFLNAGAKSILATQWQVTQKYNTEILAAFFINLQQYKTKSESLALAKRDFLKANKNTKLVAPYYWAVTTITGNDAPSYTYSNWKTISIFILFILIILFLYKLKK